MVTGVYGWTIERIAYKPLRNSTRLAPLISAIGMSLILQNYAQLSQAASARGSHYAGWRDSSASGRGVRADYLYQSIHSGRLLRGMLLLTRIISHTRLGRMCRAVQQDRKMASILGINTDRIISLVFVIGAAMAGLAGVLITMNYGTFDFYVGFVIGIKAFTAAVLGGIGSLPGDDARRADSGVAEAQFSGMVNSDYKDVFSFGLLVMILIFRPQGLLGRPVVASVKEKTMRSHGFSLKRYLLDAMFSGLIALIIFGPIAGVVLDGYSFNFAGQRPARMVGTVMVGRFLLSAF